MAKSQINKKNRANIKNPQIDPAKSGEAGSADETHLGSSNAFEETENPQSPDPDGITDEMLDELIDE